jgi:polar amino acid transport system substrate-binding protein
MKPYLYSYRQLSLLPLKNIKGFTCLCIGWLSLFSLAANNDSLNDAHITEAVDPSAIKTISIVADEWYPMNGAANENPPGFMIEIAQQAAALWDASIQYRNMPWKKAIDLVRKGHFDCVIGAYKEDAPDFVFPKYHWGVDQMAFYGKRDKDWQFRDVKDLVGQRVGVVEGYSYGDLMDEWLAKHSDQVSRINQNDALKLLVLMLIGQRIDLVVESQTVMMNKLSEEKLTTEIKELSLLGGRHPLYLACSSYASHLSRSRTIVDQMDQALQKMRESRQLESILNRYGLMPWW